MVILVQIQINIVLSILLIVLLVHAYFNMNRKRITNRLFMWIMGLTLLTLILEIFSVILNNSVFNEFMVLHKLVNIIGFIVAPCILFLGYIFTKEWVNRYQQEKIKVNKLLLLPLVINGIVTLMSYNGNGVFRITSENIYERGPLFFISPCASYIYFAYNLYFIYKYRKKFTYSELSMFSLFYIAPAILTSIQLKYSIYLTIWSSTAIIVVLTYIFILNDQAYRDTLSGLQNRLAYEHYAQNINYKKVNKLFMIYIDIDDFKKINDQYGHYEGDEAIKAFATLLVESFPLRQKKLIRLGGDEFLILLEEEQLEKVVDYMDNLTQNVEIYNNSEKKAYGLRFSYGMACYTEAYESLYQLLEYVDQLMYDQKESKKSKL
ncbi:GGDEF domain-containing protein [Clostridium tagluense]|uniref:GGDEF domain-containing protein n=1 Tax=Clostridium tagluense TaxID=360422 RepID=UPI00384F6361